MTRLELWLPVVLAALVAAYAAFQPWEDARLLFADPLIAAEESAECCSVYFGAMSMLGIFLWIGTAVICLFTVLVLSSSHPGDENIMFLTVAGVFTAWLGFDDAFMFHETIAPTLGAAQNLVLGLYVVLGLAYLWVIRKRLMDGPWLLLGVAFGGFGASLFIDVLVTSHVQLVETLEDIFKFVGITAWAMYHLAVSFEALTAREIRPAR
jgi:hypothetical protein